MKTETLLLEVGTEEIPAGYIFPALVSLQENIKKRLTDARISHGEIKVYGTPRRLAIRIEDVAEKQTSVVQEMIGPPAHVAYKDGKPTVAAQKFAEKAGVLINRLRIEKTDKGEYVTAKVNDKGRASKVVLAELLPTAILQIYFPKRMRWADLDVEFARPIRWLVALFGEKVVPFTIGNIKSGRISCGHRFMKPEKIKITHPDEYAPKLEKAFVMADISERRKEVTQKVNEAAFATGGHVLPDEELTDIVTQLVEFPVPVVGKFDADFLKLPAEILICAMREHQKYFAVADEKGQLISSFIAVNNTRAKNLILVAKGHERVLRARLEDAKFFFTADMKDGFLPWQEKLKRVLFQAKLGTLAEKVDRIQVLVKELLRASNQDQTTCEGAIEAAKLCKADLMSQVVGEFATLQGIMGRIYAEKKGYSPVVAMAIEEHYRPTRSGGMLPATTPGALVAIADKLDTICGCFNAGLIPTGAADPYALRRQAIGICQIMLAHELDFSLPSLIEYSFDTYTTEKNEHYADCKNAILNFFKGRIAQLLAEEGYAKDIVAAVLDASAVEIPNIWKRTKALQKLKESPEFEAVAATFKRVMNILRPVEKIEASSVNANLFEQDAECALYTELTEIRKKADEQLKSGDIYGALLTIASIQKATDTFFGDVMVMAEDKDVRANRLILLKEISKLFMGIADFSKIATV